MKIILTRKTEWTIETKPKKKSPAPPKQVQSNSPKNTVIINQK